MDLLAHRITALEEPKLHIEAILVNRYMDPLITPSRSADQKRDSLGRFRLSRRSFDQSLPVGILSPLFPG